VGPVVGIESPKSGDFGLLHINSAIKIAALVLLIALIGGGTFGIYSRINAQRRTSSTNGDTLQTAKATVGDLVISADGTGKIMPLGESSFGFNTSGQVSDIDVKVGDHVEAGQVLAQLDDTDAKIKLAEAQQAMDKLTSVAAIATAKQALASAQSDLATTKEALAYLISPEVLYWEEKVAEREQVMAAAQAAYQKDSSDAAKQKLREAETSLQYAQNQLKYFQAVYQETYIPKNFTQTQTRRGRGGTRTETIKVLDENTGRYVDLVIPPTEGEIGMARANYNLAKASVAEAQTYLDVLNGEEIPEGATGANLVTYMQTRDALETAKYNLNATKLIAPIRGTVTALNINVGDLASGGSAVTISNIDQPYSIDGYLDAKEWGQIQAGYEVDVSFDIIPDLVFKGTVTQVYPTLDTTSANSALVHFIARLDDPISYELPSGSTASVDVIGGRAQNAVLVPIEALHKFGNGKYALFVMQNGKLHLRVVEVGIQDLTKAQVLSGLKAGEVVSTGIVKTK
jgi:HlyD family secretion protein